MYTVSGVGPRGGGGGQPWSAGWLPPSLALLHLSLAIGSTCIRVVCQQMRLASAPTPNPTSPNPNHVAMRPHACVCMRMHACMTVCAGLHAFDLPLVYIRGDKLNQPIFGCNNLSGVVWCAHMLGASHRQPGRRSRAAGVGVGVAGGVGLAGSGGVEGGWPGGRRRRTRRRRRPSSAHARPCMNACVGWSAAQSMRCEHSTGVLPADTIHPLPRLPFSGRMCVLAPQAKFGPRSRAAGRRVACRRTISK